MADRVCCNCARCRCRSVLGPAILITLGVLFLLGEFTRWHFGELWPVLLIVIGVLKVLEYSVPMTGHQG